MMARKEKYRCLEGCISQEEKEYEKVLCHPKHDAFMEIKKKKKNMDGWRITDNACEGAQ